MTLISIITLLVSIMILIEWYYHQKDLNDDFEFFYTYGEHLDDQKYLREQGRTILIASIYNALLAIGNLF